MNPVNLMGTKSKSVEYVAIAHKEYINIIKLEVRRPVHEPVAKERKRVLPGVGLLSLGLGNFSYSRLA